MFLERQLKLLLVVLTGAAIVNTSRDIVYNTLSIDNRIWSKKQKTVKSL